MPANNEKGRKLLALVCSSVFMVTALYFSGKKSNRPNDLEARVLKLELEARVNKLGSQVEELQATAREPWTPKIKYRIRYPKNMINASKSLYFSAPGGSASHAKDSSRATLLRRYLRSII